MDEVPSVSTCKEAPKMPDKPLLSTFTGERFHPVRLHYRVADPQGLLNAFKKLRCMQEDRPKQRWVWLFDHEAQWLSLPKSYAELGKELRPIVLGSFFSRDPDHVILDLRSCERAVLAVPFFDKHIPRRVARVTEAEIVNSFFSATDNASLTPADIFDRCPVTDLDPDGHVEKIKSAIAEVGDPQEKFRIAMEMMTLPARGPLPLVERFPVHFYEDGIAGFEFFLTLRGMVAMQHWLGNADYSLHDAMQMVMK
jgi:hypothetical protein